MKLANINMLTPKKVLLTSMLAASMAVGASALNTQAKDNFDKQKIEAVNKPYTDKFISVVKSIDNYDTKLIDKISGDTQDSFTKEHKTLIRFLTGFMMSIIGGIVGNFRDERGKKYIANADTASNLGFVSGFILPGVTACISFVASIGIILKSLGESFIKK